MADFKIFLGNKNYSSWSLRGWLMLSATGAAFEELVIPLGERGTHEAILKYSPSGRVPALHHLGRRIWDSMAIGEYLHELFPEARLWPENVNARRLARSVSAEMHAGFPALRKNLPMNIRRSAPGQDISAETQQDINRITVIWRDSRHWMTEHGKNDDGFLFGHFTIADAMYAPVVSRFQTYEIEVDDDCRAYMDAVLALPAMHAWSKAARDEPQIIEEEEV